MNKPGFLILILLLCAACVQPGAKSNRSVSNLDDTPSDDTSPPILPTPTATPTPPPGSDLTMSPYDVKLFPNSKIIIEVSGGTPPYTAQVSGDLNVISQGGNRFLVESQNTTGSHQVEFQDIDGLVGYLPVNIILNDPVIPNDPSLFTQYGLRSTGQTFRFTPAVNSQNDQDIDGDEAWSLRTDCSSVLVAVIDTGADLSHPDLQANFVAGYDFIGNDISNPMPDNDPTDEHFHGTHVSGVIGAVGNNNYGMAGICWKASILPIRVLDENGSGSLATALEAVEYAMDRGAKVINLSFGGYSNGNIQALWQSTLNRAQNEGVLIITAAGNDNLNLDTNPYYPASLSSSNLLRVMAINHQGNKVSSSNYSPNKIHVAAPGYLIYSTYNRFLGGGDAFHYLTGTSMATPFVSATAAMIWAQNPHLSAAQVKEAILKETNNDLKTSLNNFMLGNGRRINLRKALQSGW